MYQKISCPVCKSELNIEVKVSTEGENALEHAIYKAIQKFLFWKLYECPKYRKDQYFYNDYQEYVKFIPKDHKSGTFEFAILVFGDPDSDIWVVGSIESSDGCLIKDPLDYRLSGDRWG